MTPVFSEDTEESGRMKERNNICIYIYIYIYVYIYMQYIYGIYTVYLHQINGKELCTKYTKLCIIFYIILYYILLF